MKYDVINLGMLIADLPVRLDCEAVDFARDTYYVDSTRITTGGDATNAAIALKRLGRSVALVSAVGEDLYAQALRRILDGCGVSTEHVVVKRDVPTLFLIALINSKGDRVFICQNRGACMELDEADFDCALLDRARHINYGSLFCHPRLDAGGALNIFREAKRRGLTTSADAGGTERAMKLSDLVPFLSTLDIFFPSLQEAGAITGEREPRAMARAIVRAAGDRHILIKLGAKGCFVHEKGGAECVVPGLEARVLDTTGAGDNFAAGVMHAFLAGWPIVECAKFGAAAAAVSVEHVGATTDATSIDSVMAMYNRY